MAYAGLCVGIGAENNVRCVKTTAEAVAKCDECHGSSELKCEHCGGKGEVKLDREDRLGNEDDMEGELMTSGYCHGEGKLAHQANPIAARRFRMTSGSLSGGGIAAAPVFRHLPNADVSAT